MRNPCATEPSKLVLVPMIVRLYQGLVAIYVFEVLTSISNEGLVTIAINEGITV